MVDPALEPAPRTLRRQLPKAAEQALDAWWERLPAESRRDVAETCADGSPPPRGLFVAGRFVDEGGEGHRGGGAFPVDLYEYLVSHEISLSDLDGPKFHICTAHEAAARVARAGLVPATFACPLARAGCPMRRVLAPGGGRSLRLYVHTKVRI